MNQKNESLPTDPDDEAEDVDLLFGREKKVL